MRRGSSSGGRGGAGEGLRLYDVTVTVRPGMPTFPGEPQPELAAVRRMSEGASSNVSRLTLSLHAGTHVDAPAHFLEGGATAEALPLAALCGPARVVSIADPAAVTAAELERAGLDGVRRVLLKTRNGALWADGAFRSDFVHLAPDAAEWLVERGTLLVGIDYLSVEAFRAEPAAHRTLLGAGVVVLEGLDLREPPPGDYALWCLPLRIAGGDAAPARVVLARREGEP